MIELIVVLVVLAIMAAFTVPSLSGFVEDAKAKDCRSKANDIKRLYIDSVIDKGVKEPKKYRSFSIVDKIVVDKYGGKTQIRDSEEDVDKTGSKVEKIYTGICPSGGIYLIQFTDVEEGTPASESEGEEDKNKAETTMRILCSCEGHTEDKAGISYMAIRTLENDIKSTNSVIRNYFSGHGSSTLDSTGATFAPDIQAILEKLGINTATTCSWRIVKTGNDYDIYWTETFINDLPLGTEIYVTKYNVSTGKFYYGKTTVGQHSDGDKNIKHIETDADWEEADG